MAAIEQSRAAPLSAILAYRAVDLAERAVAAIRAKMVADRTYRELSRLSPDLLRDIGLGEQDLASFCDSAARARR